MLKKILLFAPQGFENIEVTFKLLEMLSGKEDTLKVKKATMF